MRIFLSIIVLLFSSFLIQAQPTLSVTEFKTGFTRPVNIQHAFDDRLFIVEQPGVIKIIDSDGSVLPTPFLDIQDSVLSTGNEQGLLGLAFPPDYQNSGKFYVYYTYGSGSGRTKIARYNVSAANANIADASSEEVLLDFNQPFTNHNGGDMHFGADGYLYIGTGDGGSANDPQNRAQNRSSFHGKILRIDVSPATGYAIPEDNPYADGVNRKKEIWSWGLRNPWRFSFDRLTGDLWIGDVGQGEREEINFESVNSAGDVNYGWRCFEGNNNFINFNCNFDYTFPIFDYPHNNSSGGFSVTGGYVYRGSAMPNFYGTYVCTDYLSGNFWTISPEDNSDDWIVNIQNNLITDISAFGEDMEGELYVAKLNTGVLYKLSASCPDTTISVVISEIDDTLFADNIDGEFTWFYEGNVIDNETGGLIIPNNSGEYYCVKTINIEGCHYSATSNTINYVDCSDTTLEVTLDLVNDTLKPSIQTGSFVWYYQDTVIDETQNFHIPFNTGNYYVEVTKEEECTFFGKSNVYYVTCDMILCQTDLTFYNGCLSTSCAFGRIIWFLNGEPIDTVYQDNPGFCPTESGDYSVACYDSIAPYCIRTDGATLNNVIVSSKPNEVLEPTSIFPNPVERTLFVQLNTLDIQGLKVEVINVAGQVQSVEWKLESNQLAIDVRGLAKGTYFIKLQNDVQQYLGKFVKH